MDTFDEKIGRALSDEDRALLARHGEPGYIAQAFGLFRGPFAWVMWVGYLVGVAGFLAGVYALWRMSAAGDALTAVQWGIGALFLFQFMMLAKNFMGSHLEANRVLRELKRVELQLALLREERSGKPAR